MTRSHLHVPTLACAAGLLLANSIAYCQVTFDDGPLTDRTGSNVQAAAADPGDSNPTSESIVAETESIAAETPGIPSDPAFDRYIDIGLVGIAVTTRNASLVTDLALQLREAEAVLLREHNSGITATSLFEKAVRLATDSQDKPTLARLNKAADQLKDTQLASSIRIAEKTAGASRGATPEFMIDVNDVDATTFTLISEFIEAIRAAELIGDTAELRTVEAQIVEAALPEPYAEKLTDWVKRAIDSAPDSVSTADAAIGKLAASSRGWFENATGISTPEPIRDVAPNGLRFFRGEESTSGLMYVTPPCIDPNDGYIWTGTGSSSLRNQKTSVRAQLRRDSAGRASWVSYYKNGYGQVKSPVRAREKWDKPRSGDNIQLEDSSDEMRRFSYSLVNTCPNTIVWVTLPGNETIQIYPGNQASYTFSGRAREARIRVLNSDKSYRLKAGNHKFWLMRDGHIGFDLN